MTVGTLVYTSYLTLNRSKSYLSKWD